MIVDTLDKAGMYALGPRFDKAFAWLADPANAALEPGHYVLETLEDGTEALFVNVQAYETRTSENCPLEHHRAYADIQYLFEGTEAIGYLPLTADTPVKKEFSAENDFGLVEGAGALIPFDKPNTFFVLFPQDAHAPGHRTTAERVKKAVVKVLL